MQNIVTVSIPEALRDGLRLRSSVRLDSTDGRMLIYDLERTFVITPPPVLHDAISSFPQIEFAGNELRLWLLETGLLTNAALPQWQNEDGLALPALTDVSIDLSGNCNMGCSYCFEKSLHSRIGRMDHATLSETLDFIFKKAVGAESLSLHFGSGEPLLEIGLLRKVVTSAKDRAKRLGIRLGFELTTNATLVDKKIAEFLAVNLFNVRVSCDGPAPIHNAFRPMSSGKASYDFVIRGLNALLAVMPERVTVNSVICSGTRLSTIWNWAKSLGIRHLHVVKVGSDPTNPASMELDELADYESDLDRVCVDMLNELAQNQCPIDFQPISKIVRRLMLPAPIKRFCGVAGSYLGVATDGTVYPCFRHLGLNEYRLGDVRNGVDDEARIQYRGHEAATVNNRPLCRACWARYLCGGGCYADSVVYGPDPLIPQTTHCPFWKAEIAHAIQFFDKLRKTDPNYCLLMFGDNAEDLEARLNQDSLEFVKQRKTF